MSDLFSGHGTRPWAWVATVATNYWLNSENPPLNENNFKTYVKYYSNFQSSYCNSLLFSSYHMLVNIFFCGRLVYVYCGRCASDLWTIGNFTWNLTTRQQQKWRLERGNASFFLLCQPGLIFYLQILPYPEIKYDDLKNNKTQGL